MILVTGGSGLVGQHLKDVLPNAVYISSKDYDLTQMHEVKEMMGKYEPDIVIHLAARVGGLMDNMTYPVDYLEENIIMNTNVLKSCHEFGVEKVIGILSTCIYPDKVDTYPMTEKDLFNGPPTPTNFSYGFAKRTMAAHIESYVKQYDKKWCYLIPCNLYGEYDKYEEHHSHFVSALVKKIYEADDKIELWGDGTPLRQFMYGGDLARVIKYFIDNDIIGNYNVAPDWVHSIDEIAKIGKKACMKDKIVVTYDNDKPNGQHRKDVDSSRLLERLKDFNFTTLEDGIKKVYKKYKEII